MTQHLQVLDSCCLLCHDQMIVQDKAIAVLGTGLEYQASTSKFDFPSVGRGLHPICVPVYFGDRTETWQICQHLSCNRCRKSLRSYTFHIDCFNVLRRRVPIKTLHHAWLLGSWSCPWRGAYQHTPQIDVSLDTLAGNIANDESTKKFRSLVNSLTKLPQEIRSMIVSCSADSLGWRIARILEWRPEIFQSLQNESVVQLETDSLDGWIRPDLRDDNGFHRKTIEGIRKQARLFRLGIDRLGIQSSQFLEHRSDALGNTLPSCPWYIVEYIARLNEFKILTNHYFLRLEHCNDEEKTSNDSAFTLWNTPFPPDLAACQVIDNSGSKPERLRCISLNDSLTGFSVFCVGGQTFGIFAHTATQPSAVKTYRKILQRIKQLIWIYFPLNGKEAIQEAWVRQKEGRGVFRSPTLMIKTSHERFLAFGPYVDLEREGHSLSSLGPGPLTQLIHDDPDNGNPILYFGASRQPGGQSRQPPQPWKHARTSNARSGNRQFFYSSARLGKVKKARLFHDDDDDDDSGLEDKTSTQHASIGMLFTYEDGSQEALGQCHVGLAKSTEIPSPTQIHWRNNSANRGLDICFSQPLPKQQLQLIESEAHDNDNDEIGWKSTEMSGVLEWWFSYFENIIVRTELEPREIYL